MPLLKKCPSCRRRFGVTVVEKRLIDTDLDVAEASSTVLVPTGRGQNVGTGNPVTRSVRVRRERDEYETSFKCAKCGHRWSERSTVLKRT